MKKFFKRFVIFISVLAIGGLIASEAGLFKTKAAATPLFTLDAIPTVNHEVAGTNSVNVGNITQYIDAVNNPAVDVINFTTNITAGTVGQAMGLSVNRDLRINGNGFTLTITGNASFGPNSTGSAGGTHLLLGGTGGTLHLQNLRLNRATTGAGQNDFISIMTGTNETWDIIFDDFTSNFSTNQWSTLTRSTTGIVNSTRIFLRNTIDMNLGAGSTTFITNGAVVAEENSTVNVTARSTNSIRGGVGSDTRLYIAPGSNTTLGLPPQIWSGNRGALHSVKEVNVYPTATLNLSGTGNATTPALTSLDSVVGLVLRIDSDASLKVENTAGPAIISTGTYPVRILGNPDSTLEVFGTGANTTAQMTLSGSEMSLSAPKYYNIQNSGTGAAFSGVGASTPTLKLTETNVGVWLKGQPVAGNPQTPSPFANVDLITGTTAALAGSSPIVDTMSGGWNTSNYSRIAYADVVEITAADINVGLGRTKVINPQVIPLDATLTYTSGNPAIATVNTAGTVTGVGVGTTTITISGIGGPGVFPGSTTINVTVTNNPPVLTVPAFTEVALNSVFDPKTGVTATDAEDGNLISSVQVLDSVDTQVPGLNVVNYSLTDFNGNTVTAKQVVLVQDNNFVVGTNTIIHATDFTKRPTQVDTTPSAIKTAAGVKVYSKATGAELVNEPVTITEDSGYSSAVNTYPITFAVDQEASTNITIDAHVVTGELPVLTVNPAFVKVPLNGTFNQDAGVTATDAEDGTITDKVSVDNPVNTAVAGVYVVTYTITDLDGNSVSKTRTVLIQDGNFTVGTNTIIKATDFTKRPTQVDTAPSAIKAAAGVKVYNKATGLELVNEPVTITEDSGYNATLGTYAITFEVGQDSNATITINANVVTGELPVITLAPAFIEVPLNGTFDQEAGVTATDLEDGDFASGDITASGSVNTSQAGIYTVTYSVTDSDGNTTTAKRIVLVNDGTFSVGTTHMLKATDFTKRVGQVNTSDAAIKTAAGVKVYNKTTGLEDTVTGVTITDKGGYTNVVSTYNIAFQVNGDTTAQRIIVASVVAGQPPSLNVPAFTEVALDGSFNPETGVTAEDTEEGDLIDDVIIDGSVDTSVAGLYILNYSVTDGDGNSATAKQVVLVNDGNYSVGDTYILQAKNFGKRVGQVDTTPAAIKTAANVKVYSKATGLEDATTVNITSIGGYTNVVGDYTIDFEIAGDTVAQRTITATVSAGSPPTLTVPAFAEIDKGDTTFDPTDGVSATDNEDGPFDIGDIIITGNVDVETAGVYTLTYTVTDLDGNSDTAHQVVLVNDGNYSAGESNILFAKDFTNRISQVDNSAAAIKVDAQAKIYSKTTGVFIASATINVIDKGGYDAVEGTYDIVLEIGGDTATRTVKGNVIPGASPVLTVNPAFVEVTLNGTFDQDAGVTSIDAEDGPITDDIEIDNPVNTAVAGVYPVTYTSTDTDGNSVTKIRTVLVQDDNFVVGTDTIIRASDFTKRPSQVDTAASAIKSAAGVKVYDKLTGEELVNEPVTITEDSGYSSTVATYPITFQVDQETGTTITIDANVVTGGIPVLTVNPAFVEVPLNGTFNQDAGVSSIDAEDGNITGNIDIDNPVNTALAGVYAVTYISTDTDGNSVTKTRTVLVQDNNFVVGTNTIIRASDFTKRPSQVVTTDAAIKTAAGVKVYNKITGLELVNEPITITEDSGFSSTVATYPITFQVDQETSTTITIDANVVTGGIPVLTVNPAFVEVPLNGTFDQDAGVTATDAEDGTITDNIDIDNPVNTAVPGVNVVTYTITDTDGNSVTKTRTVLVQDNNFIVGTNTIIQATDFTKRPSQVDTTPAAIKAAAGVKVYNKVTGLELVNEPVTIVENSGYSPVVKTYPITFKVDQDATATITIDAHVVTGGIPVLTVNPAFKEVPLNGSFNVMNGVTAIDAEDGDITPDLDIDNPVDTSVPGVYPITYTTTDTDGNSVTKTRTVLVQDSNFIVGTNTIIQATDFMKRPSEVDTAPSAIKTAAGVKVYDKLTGLELVNEPVTITEDTGYGSVVKVYPITFEVDQDAAATITINAHVVTGEAPVLVVPELTEVSLNGIFDPRINVSATDFEDGIITPNIDIEENTVNTGAVGVYHVNYSVTDLDGNRAEATQIVVVSDGEMTVGDNTILFATNFQKRVGQVDTSAAAIRTAANVKVYDRTTGQEIPDAVVNIVDLGNYHAAVGTYPITFEVSGDSQSRKTINATVVTGSAPVLTVPAFRETLVNGNFDLLTDVIATDDEDGNLITEVKVVGEFDNTLSGVYTLQYNVVDSDGNRASAEGVILVDNGEFNVGDTTIIQASDFVKRISEVDTSDAAVIKAANVKLYNKVTGKEVENPQITVNDIGGYSNLPDEYTLTFSATQDPAATQSVIGTVVSGAAPVIDVPPFTEVLLNGDFDPMTGVTVTDDEDTDIADKLIVTESVDTTKAGVYTVHYEVTDADGNRIEALQVVLVQNGKFSAGDNNIIYAENFEKRVSQVDLSETAILAAAKVRIFDKITGEELTVADVTIGALGGYQAAPGIYNIKFEAINDASTNITIKATVAQGTPPVLEVPTLTEVPINGSFDAMTGVSATDDEDGDITRFVQVSGIVDVNTVGIYTLNYSITDKDGNTVTAQQIVLVSDGELVVGERTILYADDFTKRVGQVDTSAAALLIAANVRVYDKDTGLEIVGEPVTIVNKGGYGPIAGSYPITFSVTSDPTARTTIVGKVITGNKPVLTVDPAFVEVALNGTFDPDMGVEALDDEDGDITGMIDTEGTVDTSVPGVYPVTYTITDTDFNKVTKTRVVLVQDPSFTVGDTTILQANDFTKRVGEVDTSPDAIKLAAGVNVYDKLTGLILPTEAVNIVNTNGYGPSVGDYPITFRVASDGLATRTVNASVVTGALPVLTVDPAFMEVPLNGTFDPETGVSASDLEDGNLTTEVKITGLVDTHIAGVYTVTYTITDSDQNVVRLKRVVLVNDGQASVGNNFIMTGEAFTKRLSEVDLTESAIKEAAQVRVFDKVTGVETFTNTITITDLGGYQATPGDYNITFGLAEDSAVQLTLVGTVLTDTPPQLIVPKFTEIGLNGSFNPKKGVSATDVEDGDITNLINVQGQVDVTKPGVYAISYDVTDSDHNKVKAVQTVLVNDGNFNYGNGYIIQGNDFRIGLSKANLTDEDMIALAGIRVFDVETQTWVNNPLIRVDRGNFGAQVGDYKITFIFNPDITINVSVYQDSVNSGPGDVPPPSGDDSNVLGFGLLLSLAGVALAGMARKKLNKNSK